MPRRELTFEQRQRKRDRQRAWLAARRMQWLDENGPCVECGSWDDLEVDHIDPATKNPKLCHPNGTGSMWSWSRERLDAELAKCQVLCSECHERKTHTDRSDKRWSGRKKKRRR